ncbi:MAG: response regulator transcription factor [Hyphomicrobiaceae bacterium]|nr:response regulator transcription factor [Hyphomicrobiaceae bacterium]
MAAKVRIAVVDDHPIFREGVAQALCSADDLELVAEGSSAAEAIEIAQDHLPDVLLLDIDMPGSGLDAVRTIARQCPRVKVMMLTVSGSEEHLDSALQAGAHAYVLKGVSGPDFLTSVRAVHDDGHCITPEIATRLLAKAMKRSIGAAGTAELPTLTAREEDILRLIANTYTTWEISERLNLSEKIVCDYISNIMQKLHLRARVESALFAGRH